jgi:hypothetical protein
MAVDKQRAASKEIRMIILLFSFIIV